MSTPALPSSFDAGALEQVEEAAVLRDPAFYHGIPAFKLDVETGKGGSCDIKPDKTPEGSIPSGVLLSDVEFLCFIQNLMS